MKTWELWVKKKQITTQKTLDDIDRLCVKRKEEGRGVSIEHSFVASAIKGFKDYRRILKKEDKN